MDARVIDLATAAFKRGLVLVINRDGTTELVRVVQPGQQRIGVVLKPAKAAA
jgi:hypothetical protein